MKIPHSSTPSWVGSDPEPAGLVQRTPGALGAKPIGRAAGYSDDWGVLGTAETLLCTLNTRTEEEPHFPVQSLLDCGLCSCSALSCPHTAPRPKAEPWPSGGRPSLEVKRGQLENGGLGSPSSSLLALIIYIYISYSCENLGPPEAVAWNGSLVLVVLGINLPGRFRAVGKNA